MSAEETARRLLEAQLRHAEVLSRLVPPHGRGERAPSSEQHARDVIAAHGVPDHIDVLQVILTTHSGVPPLRLQAPSEGDPLSVRQLDDLSTHGPTELPDGRWALAVDLPQGVHGRVVAIAPTAEALQSGRQELTSLASDLAIGAHLGRWAADAEVLCSLSTQQTDTIDPPGALAALLRRVRQRMRSDGARLHLVRRTPTGLMVKPLEPTNGPTLPPAQLEQCMTAGEAIQVRTAGSRHLLAPLHALGHPAGLLEVWREGDEAFDDPHDEDALTRFAPHVAAAARRVLHDDTLRLRLERMAELLQRLQQHVVPLRVAAATATELIGRLADAGAALLVRRSPADELYLEAAWCADDDLATLVPQAMSGAIESLQLTELPWPVELPDLLRVELASWGLDGRLSHRRTYPSTTPAGMQPTSAVVVLDTTHDTSLHHPFAPDITNQAAAEFIHYATALLENATRSTARACSDRLAEAPARPQAIALTAAEELAKATGADAVVIALGDQHLAHVRAVFPARQSLIGKRLEAIDGELSQRQLNELAGAFGWGTVRSWAAANIEDRDRQHGMIALLSGAEGPALGWHRREVLESVASRMALELDNAHHRAMLEDLNTIAGHLAGTVGDTLANRMRDEMQSWIRTYMRADAMVAIVARAQADRPLLLCASDGIDDDLLRVIHLSSRRWGRTDLRWSPEDAPETLASLGMHGLAAPLFLPENDQLTGHILVMSRHPLLKHHVETAAEAARELAVLLDAERQRHNLRAQTGLFRHALLSPVQGLADAAQYLSDLAGEADADPELVRELRVQVHSEAEMVRRWRSIQQVYGGSLMGDRILLRKRRQSLRPFVDTCARRFARTLELRHIALAVDWQVRGAGKLDLDQVAVDLILSNLLDNACKYSFYNRKITIGAHEDRANLHLWVEDIGHPTPEDTDIYAMGARLDWEDPFRPIHGEGLGLRIARALAIEHGGDLSHTCRPVSDHLPPDAREDTRPYKVRFTLTLPRESR